MDLGQAISEGLDLEKKRKVAMVFPISKLELQGRVGSSQIRYKALMRLYGTSKTKGESHTRFGVHFIPSIRH